MAFQISLASTLAFVAWFIYIQQLPLVRCILVPDVYGLDHITFSPSVHNLHGPCLSASSFLTFPEPEVLPVCPFLSLEKEIQGLKNHDNNNNNNNGLINSDGNNTTILEVCLVDSSLFYFPSQLVLPLATEIPEQKELSSESSQNFEEEEVGSGFWSWYRKLNSIPGHLRATFAPALSSTAISPSTPSAASSSFPFSIIGSMSPDSEALRGQSWVRNGILLSGSPHFQWDLEM